MFTRSIGLILLGTVDLIPGLESAMTHTIPMVVYFTSALWLWTQTIINDMNINRTIVAGSAFTLACSLYIATITPTLPSIIACTLLLALTVVQLCTNKSPFRLLQGLWQRSTTKKTHTKNQPLLHYPSTKHIVLLWSVLLWEISIARILHPLGDIFNNMLPDALLLLGSYNISTWVKQRMQSHITADNHNKLINVKINGKQTAIPIATLKKGMRICIDKDTLLPVTSISHGCLITDDAAEKQVMTGEGEHITANVWYHKGEVSATQDYKATSLRTIAAYNKDNDERLNYILSLGLAITISLAVNTAYTTHSLIKGLQSLCINLLVCCPCVFTVAKPILHHKFLQWLENNTSILFNKITHCFRPNIIIFDRTNTLYQANPKAPSGPYQLISNAKTWLKELTNNNISCYILSGHNTGQWEKNHHNCCSELNGILKAEHILFDKKYHNDHSAKAKVIKQLQKYGQLKQPTTLLERCYQYIRQIFGNYTVAMIGDGNNDSQAMQQADLAICVAKDIDNANDNVLRHAHFVSSPKDLENLPSLIKVLSNTNSLISLFITTALIFNTTLLAIANGWFSVSSYMQTPSLICTIASLGCVVLTIAASLCCVTYNTYKTKINTINKREYPSRKINKNCNNPKAKTTTINRSCNTNTNCILS